MLIDAHAHLTDDELFVLKDYIIMMINRLNIKVVSVSMDLITSERNLELSSDAIIPFVGIHPWSINEDLERFEEFVIANIDKIYGIGEIGLDKKYAKDGEEYERQKHIFRSMLDIAEKYDKSVSIHSRASLDDIFEILSSYNLRVLLHWFAGSKKQLRYANEHGYYVSYGPALLYASDKPHLLQESEKELILIETDSPVHYPRCFEERMAMPSYLISVAYAVSNILGFDYCNTCNMLTNNTLRYLAIE
ncbi:MAG: TatD family hydrolase [Candidatus Nitrosocaldaceae archaeon]